MIIDSFGEYGLCGYVISFKDIIRLVHRYDMSYEYGMSYINKIWLVDIIHLINVIWLIIMIWVINTNIAYRGNK